MKNAAAIFIGIVIVLIAIVDVYLIIGGGTEASISNQLVTWSYDYPAFTFLLGYAMGHVTWRMRDTKNTGKLGR